MTTENPKLAPLFNAKGIGRETLGAMRKLVLACGLKEKGNGAILAMKQERLLPNKQTTGTNPGQLSRSPMDLS